MYNRTSGMNNRFVPKFTIGFKQFKNEFWNAICKRFKPIVNYGKRPLMIICLRCKFFDAPLHSYCLYWSFSKIHNRLKPFTNCIPKSIFKPMVNFGTNRLFIPLVRLYNRDDTSVNTDCWCCY
jgi:hypothetical protein